MAKSIRKLLKSFTLIELIIVIAIIAVLGATAFLLLTQWMSKGRDAQRISDLSTIKTALDIALSKNDELPLPDENSVLLYSGTEILYQGKFGENVVKSIGTLNKVPNDRVNGEYEYSLLYDKKTYRVRAEIENEAYVFSFLNRGFAGEYFYRFVGKDMKAVSVKQTFLYLPSMFISGYNEDGTYDLYNNDLDVFVGNKIGEYKTGLALPVNNIEEIRTKLGILGIEDDEIDQIIAQGTGQPKIVNIEKCSGELPANAVMNGAQKSRVDLTYNETAGECTYICEEGYYFTGSLCELSKVLTGNATDGFKFFENGIQIYPKNCNDLLVSTGVDFKTFVNGGTFSSGFYQIDLDGEGTLLPLKAYCDMSEDGGGRTRISYNQTTAFAWTRFRDCKTNGYNYVTNFECITPTYFTDIRAKRAGYDNIYRTSSQANRSDYSSAGNSVVGRGFSGVTMRDYYNTTLGHGFNTGRWNSLHGKIQNQITVWGK